MPEPVTATLGTLMVMHIVATCTIAAVGHYAQQPSIVHNNTFVYNDTFVKNITHTHVFNEYYIENSTVSIAMLDGSSCVIPDLLRGIQRTACTQNTDNPHAIAQFTELATGLNDTVTGVHVTIGSVSKSVLEMHQRSDKIMQVLNSLEKQTNTIPGVQATIGSVSERVYAIQTQSQQMMQVLNLVKNFPTILKLNEEKQALELNVVEKQAEITLLTQESKSQQAKIDSLVQQSKNQQTEIARLTQESTSRQAIIDSLQSTQCLPGNNYQTPVPPAPAGEWVWCYVVCVSLLVLCNRDRNIDANRQKKLRALFERFKNNTKNSVEKRDQKIIQKMQLIKQRRQEFLKELEIFIDDLPMYVEELMDKIITTSNSLGELHNNLKNRQVQGWSSFDNKDNRGLSNLDRIEKIVKYLQKVCRSAFLMGKFGKEIRGVHKNVSAKLIQKWYKKHRGRDRITTSGSSEPSTEIDTRPEPSTEIYTRPGTPVGTPEMPETPETPPQTKPEQRTAPVVVVPQVCKQRAPTRAGAPVSKPSVQVDDAPAEWRTDWDVAVLSAFLAEVVVFVLLYINHICNLV